jgi:hypothetical protein
MRCTLTSFKDDAKEEYEKEGENLPPLFFMALVRTQLGYP